jgi:iron-sulfur cluster repair protein YtfE (RIC family)
LPTARLIALVLLQDILLDSLQQLLDSAIDASAHERDALVHELRCKVEEVHVTLQKHLRKEEDQLFPLLLQHFNFSEQADLVVRPIRKPPAVGNVHEPSHSTPRRRYNSSVAYR